MASCAVCLEPYNATDRAPHTLPSCEHEYCAKCLATLLRGGVIVCPQDRAETRTASVAELPRGPSFQATGPACELCDEGDKHAATHYCEECEERMCEADAKKHKKPKSSKDHVIVAVDHCADGPPRKAPRVVDTPKCPTHGKDIEFFDKKCRMPVCVHPASRWTTTGTSA